jgi:catechol 2,3-dioxygenase-like lactoylglutathione lyase family enzyme
MHDTVDLDEAVAFWTVVLGMEVVHRDETYAYLSRIGETGPRLAFQLVEEPRSGKNRLHLDVKVPDRKGFEAFVVRLGGSVVAEHDVPGYPTWTVMADQQGNEFCIYEVTDKS